jgi:hypothetical protein
MANRVARVIKRDMASAPIFSRQALETVAWPVLRFYYRTLP